MKLNRNPTDHLEYHINDLVSKRYFPRYRYQLSYLAKFSKNGNGEENVFHKLVKSDLTYNHSDEDHTIHCTLMQKLDDEQLERSGFGFQFIFDVLLEN